MTRMTRHKLGDKLKPIIEEMWRILNGTYPGVQETLETLRETYKEMCKTHGHCWSIFLLAPVSKTTTGGHFLGCCNFPRFGGNMRIFQRSKVLVVEKNGVSLSFLCQPSLFAAVPLRPQEFNPSVLTEFALPLPKLLVQSSDFIQKIWPNHAQPPNLSRA